MYLLASIYVLHSISFCKLYNTVIANSLCMYVNSKYTYIVNTDH